MSGAVLSVPCNTCRRLFRPGSELKYHIKRDHQPLVKVTFRDGSIIDIERGKDGMFQCICNRPFSEPNSIHRHAKSCEVNSEEKHQNKLEKGCSEGEEERDSEEHDLPIDCIGKKFQITYT